MEYSQDGTLWYDCVNHVYTVGITDQALDDWGKIEFMSISPKGTQLEVNDSLAEVEAEKTVTDIPSPVAGEIIEVFDLDYNQPMEQSKRYLVKIAKR